MAGLSDKQDAFGHGMHDFLQGRAAAEIAERDDGCLGLTGGPGCYFREYREWPSLEKRALRLARGRVLDIGCGAGRVALHLQGKGLDVLGVDNSPMAVKVCKARGLKKARVVPVTQLSRKLGLFGTIVMFGNNFGLVGNVKRAKWLLRRFHAMTTPDARIIAESRDPYHTDEPLHLAYHKRNRRQGRMGGQIRLRVRYKVYATPWIDVLMVSREEMTKVLDGTGWHVRQCLDGDGSLYAAVMEKGD